MPQSATLRRGIAPLPLFGPVPPTSGTRGANRFARVRPPRAISTDNLAQHQPFGWRRHPLGGI